MKYGPARSRSFGYRTVGSYQRPARSGTRIPALDWGPVDDWAEKGYEFGKDVVEFGKEIIKEDIQQLSDCSGDILQPECVVLLAGALPVGKLGSVAIKGVAKAKRARQAKRAREAKECHSFVPATAVLLADGSTRPIKDVKTGDKVLVTDPETGETAPREVVGTIVTEDDKEFVDLKVAGPEGEKDSLIATVTHPFWVEDTDSWVDAGDLKAGMSLRTPDGATVKVASTRHFSELQRTHDLTISGVHTYYVVAGEAPVLVHNNSCPPDGNAASNRGSKKKRAEHLQPDNDNAEGDHTRFERDEIGRIKRYQTWFLESRAPSGWRPGPRFRGTGKPHSGVNPPLYYPKGTGYGESATGENLPLGY
ncbi:polymorphic toxin-type HINT domain-containing protein [Streptomyces buecherae]|uniref:polymorphic toxin-type HINT domain-containing protein n=1 Tax=Streptomyces buecherae TaxID=2763006 RepID=UPI0039F69425